MKLIFLYLISCILFFGVSCFPCSQFCEDCQSCGPCVSCIPCAQGQSNPSWCDDGSCSWCSSCTSCIPCFNPPCTSNSMSNPEVVKKDKPMSKEKVNAIVGSDCEGQSRRVEGFLTPNELYLISIGVKIDFECHEDNYIRVVYSQWVIDQSGSVKKVTWSRIKKKVIGDWMMSYLDCPGCIKDCSRRSSEMVSGNETLVYVNIANRTLEFIFMDHNTGNITQTDSFTFNATFNASLSEISLEVVPNVSEGQNSFIMLSFFLLVCCSFFLFQ